MRVRWTRSAVADLREMFEYIAVEDVEAARRLKKRISEATKELRDFAEIGRMIPEFGNPLLRERIVPPYRVVYSLIGEEVRILGLVHSRRIMPHFAAGR